MALSRPAEQVFKFISKTTELNNWLHRGAGQLWHHKHPRVQAWLQCHPRFVPSLCAHEFQLAQFGAALVWRATSKRIRRGSFGSMEDLEKAIAEFLAPWNQHRNRLCGPPM